MSLPVPVSWKVDRALGLVRSGILEVRPDGSVWRLQMWNHGILKPCAPRRIDLPSSKGYRKVTLYDPSVGLFGVMAHTLVFLSNGGTIEDGQQINHKNLTKDDNRFENLEACFQPHNIQHSYRHGRVRPWTHAKKWRLSPPEVEAVYLARKSGCSLADISRQFGISATGAAKLFRRESQRRKESVEP